MNDKTSSAASAGGEFLSFTLGAEHYGVDILKVQEILGYDAVTRVPDAPDYIKGVINLRGTIVPVIDLRLKLRLDNARYDAFTVMIVLNVEDRVVGIVVDSVSDVIPLSAEQIRPTPEFGAAVDTRFISGIGMVFQPLLCNVEHLGAIPSALRIPTQRTACSRNLHKGRFRKSSPQSYGLWF